MTGQELRDIRQGLAWTQERLASYLGLSANHVAQLERGTRRLTERTARAAYTLHLVHRLAVTVGLIEPPSPLH